jgi:hypothetical protein
MKADEMDGTSRSTRDMRSDLNIIRTWIKNAVGRQKKKRRY